MTKLIKLYWTVNRDDQTVLNDIRQQTEMTKPY